MVKYAGKKLLGTTTLLVMMDQFDCVLFAVEKLASKQLFLNHQYSTGMSFLLLLPNMLSIDCQTNDQSVRMHYEDFPLFLRQ